MFGLPGCSDSNYPLIREFSSKANSSQRYVNCSSLKKTHASPKPKDPLSDGILESLNKTLATMLSSYVNKSQKQDWSGYLPFVLMVCSTV